MCDRVAIIHRGRILREGSVSELIAGRRELELRVDDPARAAQLLDERGIAHRVNGNSIVAAVDEDDAPPLIAALVQGGVSIFHAAKTQHTLEDLFLEATGGETVE